MKRFPAIITILILTASIAPAYVRHRSLGMPIAAYTDRYHSMIITPIHSSPADAIGMPFYLTGSDVQYDHKNATTAGREIATWELHSNYTPITITIKAENLTLVSKTGTGNDADIPYILFFPYVYSAYDSSTGKTVEVAGYMEVSSGKDYTSTGNAISAEVFDANGNRMGINTGTYPIRFMLTEDATTNLGSYTPGTYRATVTVTTEGTE